jgi:hypothetical protein
MSAPSSASSSGRLASWLPALAAGTAAAAIGYAMYRSVRAAEQAWEDKEGQRPRGAPAASASTAAAAAAAAGAASKTAPPRNAPASPADVPPKDASEQQQQAKKPGGPSLPPRPASSGGGSSTRRAGAAAAASASKPAAAANNDTADDSRAGDVKDAQAASKDNQQQQQQQQHARGAACDACGKEGSSSNNHAKPLQRCTRCRDAFYCGPSCQRSHAPEHRADCERKAALLEQAKAKIEAAEQQQPMSGEEAAGPPAPAATAAAEAKQQHQQQQQQQQEQQAPAAAPPAGNSSAPAAAPARSDAQTVMEALAAHLEGRHGDGGNGASQQQQQQQQPPNLPRLYERAVVAFVRGEYASAIEQMKGVRALAEAEGDRAVAGDALRWTGHAHNRLGDATAATRAFVEGVEIARAAIAAEEGGGDAAAETKEGAAAAAAQKKEEEEEEEQKKERDGDGDASVPRARPKLTREQRLARLRKLEIDCLSGLGVMARGQGRPTEAVTHLQAALDAAGHLGDRDVRAGVLANLGAARLPLDRARATTELAESVALRERRVVELHAAGERQGLATAILEHAGSLVSLAGALYAGRRHREAAGAYERALDVFEAIGDGDKALGALANLANLHELQMADRDAAELEAHARAASATRRRRRSGGGGGDGKGGDGAAEEEEEEEEEDGVVVAGAARRRAAAFRKRLHDLAKEVLPERGEQEAACALCDEPLEVEAAAAAAAAAGGGEEEGGAAATKHKDGAKPSRRRRIIVLGCLHSHHEPCWRAWCERPGQPECPSCAREAEAAAAGAAAAAGKGPQQPRQPQQEA